MVSLKILKGEIKMNIISALMKTDNMRVSLGNRWIVFNKTTEEWITYEHKLYAKRSLIICQSYIQDEAIEALLK